MSAPQRNLPARTVCARRASTRTTSTASGSSRRVGQDVRESQSRRQRRPGRHVSGVERRRSERAPSRPRTAPSRRGGSTPAPKRAEYLYAPATILKRDKEKIAREMTREMGKVLDETRGDVQEAIDMAFLMAGEGRRLFGVTTPSELPNKFNMAVRMPLGVAGLITPWNFPIAIPAWKSMAALICGNTVVIKPASLTPLSVVMLAEAFEEAGLPKGVFERGDRRRQGSRRADDQASEGRGDLVHRIDRGRAATSRSPARRRSSTSIWRWAART